MRKKILAVMLGLSVCLGLTGCQQYVTKKFGGSMTINLEPNQKLEEITWKDDDVAETHTFQQSTELGVFEGTVTIIESKTE